MRYIICLLLFSSLNLCRADVYIPIKDRVPNSNFGVCAWCSVEMCGNYMGVDKIKGLTDWHRPRDTNGVTFDGLTRQLDIWEIKYQAIRETTLAVLKETIKHNIPVTVNFRLGSSLGEHACVVTAAHRHKIFFVDPNDIYSLYSLDEEDFLEQWGGWYIVILPDQSE